MTFIKTHRKYLTTAGVIWAGCLVVFLIVYVLILGPQRNYDKRVENELAEKKQVYEFAVKAAQEETKIRLNEQIESLQSRLGDFVIDFEGSANLTFDISQIASEKKIVSFSIKNKDNKGLVAIPDCSYIFENQININFTGGFNQFAVFLNALERHRPVIFVDEFTISRSQNDSGYKVSLDVVALVKKQQDVKGTDKFTAKVYGGKI